MIFPQEAAGMFLNVSPVYVIQDDEQDLTL